MKKTQTEINKAEKKAQIAIDKMIDLESMGYGGSLLSSILEKLRELESKINQG